MIQRWHNLSNTYKILITMLLFILLIQLGTLLYIWKFESNVLLQKERENLQYQLEIDAKLLANRMERLQREMEFLSSLEIMDDILSGDIDKRIAIVLEKKAKDIGESVTLSVENQKGKIIARSTKESTPNALLFKVPIHASFDSNRKLGNLLLYYPLQNLTRLHVNNPHQRLWLTHPLYPKLFPTHQASNTIMVTQPLKGKLHGWSLHLSYAKEYALESLEQIERILLVGSLFSLLATLLVIWRLSQKQIQLLEHTQEILELKRTFLSTMSHELRTPLGSILNLTQHLIISPKLGDDEIEMLGRIENASSHLLSMINALLQLSKLESNTMTLTPVPMDPKAVIVEMIEMVEPLIQEKGLQLYQHLPERTPLITSDINLFKQVVLNLLSNAIKFTDKGHISIRLKIEEKRMQLSIQDTGIGIAPEKQASLFCEFYQAHTKEIKHSTGLGLALSQKVAHLINGEITIQSKGEGYGSLAIFTFASL